MEHKNYLQATLYGQIGLCIMMSQEHAIALMLSAY